MKIEIEPVSPEFERIVSANPEYEMLPYGFGPEADPKDDSRAHGGIFPNPGEGPVWWKEGGFLVWSDIGHSRTMKWAEGEDFSVFREPTNFANGLTRDAQGRLVACEQGLRRVTRIEYDGSVTVIANNYRGMRLNRPNDVVVTSDGATYFTDPGAPAPGHDLDFSGVFRVSPDLGDITLLVRDFTSPNGLTFSPDEKILYLVHARNRQLWAFDVQANGCLNLASRRMLYELESTAPPGVFDGMKTDMEGNVYMAGPGGIWVVAPSGEHLGIIWVREPVHPEILKILPWRDQTVNIGFGQDDWKTLYYTGMGTIGRIQLKVPGVPVPRGAL